MTAPNLTPLHRLVARHDYRTPWMVFFIAVRVVQIAALLTLLAFIVKWGFA